MIRSPRRISAEERPVPPGCCLPALIHFFVCGVIVKVVDLSARRLASPRQDRGVGGGIRFPDPGHKRIREEPFASELPDWSCLPGDSSAGLRLPFIYYRSSVSSFASLVPAAPSERRAPVSPANLLITLWTEVCLTDA